MLFPYIFTGFFLVGHLVTGCTYLDDFHHVCSIWTYNDCWCYMEPHIDDLEESIVPTYTDEELTPLCDAYFEVELCMAQFIHDCHSSLQNEFKSANDTWHYLCVETRSEYLNHHRVCLDNDYLKERGEDVCYDHLVEELDELRYSDKDLETIYKDQCHLVNNYLDCVENLIKNTEGCTEATALWQRELDRRWIDALLTGTNCKLDNSTGKTIYIYRDVHHTTEHTEPEKHSAIPTGVVIGCSVLLAIIILIVGLMVVFKCMYNKKQQQRQQSASTNNQSRPQNNLSYGQPYGYGGGAVAFGVFEDALPGKDGEKGSSTETDNPPAYNERDDEEMGFGPPSQPPPYTGFPQSANNPRPSGGNTTGTTGSTMTDIGE